MSAREISRPASGSATRNVAPSPGSDSAATLAAVRLGDRGDDREPEPDAAARAGARGVGAVEALEDVLELLRVHARARSRRPRARRVPFVAAERRRAPARPGGVWARTFASRLSTTCRRRSRSPSDDARRRASTSIGRSGLDASAPSRPPRRRPRRARPARARAGGPRRGGRAAAGRRRARSSAPTRG